MRSWPEIISILKSNHLYPSQIIEEDEITGVEVFCPCLQKDNRLKAIQETVGDEFNCQFLPNESAIVIKKINHE